MKNPRKNVTINLNNNQQNPANIQQNPKNQSNRQFVQSQYNYENFKGRIIF